MGLTRATLPGERRPERPSLSPPQAVTALGSADPDRRRQGALALRDSPDAAAAVGDALMREEHLAAREAMLLTLRSADRAAVARVGEALLRRDELARRIAGVELLAASPTASAGTLAGLLRDPDPDLRGLAAAAVALGAVPLERELLEALAADPDAGVRCALLEALRCVGGAAAVDALAARYGERTDDLEAFAAVEARAAAARRSGR